MIRPTTERLHELTKTGHLGICATEATVQSMSYVIEAEKYAPDVTIHQQACPMWVPIVENDEQDSPAAGYYSQKYIEQLLGQHTDIDAVLLACTHYPILRETILEHLPDEVQLISQGSLVAASLKDYLSRHIWLEEKCAKGGKLRFQTTDSTQDFDTKASKYFGRSVDSEHVTIS